LISLTSAAKTTLVKAAQEDAVDEHTGDSSLVIADDSDVEDEQASAVAQPAPAKAPAQAVVQAQAVPEALAPVPAQTPTAPKVVKKVVRTAKKE
jgi:hypothetical protein